MKENNMKEDNMNIDDFLRKNKPKVKDNPTFMLETRVKMEAMEGIKNEVDRNRKTGLLAIIVALVVGLAAGAATSAFILLAPKQPLLTSNATILAAIEEFLQTWKYLIYGLTVGCAIVLGIVLQSKGYKSLI